MRKFRSVAETKIPFEYNKNIASRPKSDLAFKLHYLTWISEIKHKNLEVEPFNINGLLQRLSIDTYNQLKADSKKGASCGVR